MLVFSQIQSYFKFSCLGPKDVVSLLVIIIIIIILMTIKARKPISHNVIYNDETILVRYSKARDTY
jgi:hypothetical protein